MRRPKAGDPTKAVAYLRASTDDQHLGPEAQIAAIRRWASASSISVVGVFDDLGVSGSEPLARRPGLLACLDHMTQAGAGILVVAKRDRLGRDPIVVATIETAVSRRGGKVASTAGEGTENDDPSSLLMRRIADVFAEYERLLIQARTKAALAVLREKGLPTGGFGGVRFGFALSEDRTKLVELPAERAVIAKMRQLRLAGVTLRDIADDLNNQQVPARGVRWHPTTVARILSREGVTNGHARKTKEISPVSSADGAAAA